MIKINEKVSKLVSESEKELDGVFRGIDDVCEYNSMKVLSAFNRNNVLNVVHSLIVFVIIFVAAF